MLPVEVDDENKTQKCKKKEIEENSVTFFSKVASAFFLVLLSVFFWHNLQLPEKKQP